MDFGKVLNEEIYRLGAPKVLDDMLNALEPSDIRKGYARRKLSYYELQLSA